MMELLTLGNLLLWIVVSILILFVWAACIDDPGVSHTSNIILTTICAILALPVTLVVLIAFFIMDRKFRDNDEE